MSTIRALWQQYRQEKTKSRRTRQERGYFFEDLARVLFEQAGMAPRVAYRAGGDQIDGAFRYRNEEFLVELKWTSRPVSGRDIDAFGAKLRRARQPGLCISLGGYEGVDTHLAEEPMLLLADRADFEAVLKRKTSLWELLDVKLDAWPHERRVHFSARDKRFRRTQWYRALRHSQQVTSKEIIAIGAKYRSHLYVHRCEARAIDEMIEGDVRDNSLALVIERAGSGKTNLICHLAEHYSRQHAVFLVRPGVQFASSLGLAVYLTERYGTDRNVLRRTEGEQFILDTAYLASAHGRKVVILIDAINESPSPALMKDEILGALARWRDRDILFVVTCRDIYWGQFEDPNWYRYQPIPLRNRLYHFTREEYEGKDGALKRYWAHYRIQGRLVGRAYGCCRHPLLLNFFCRAFEGENIRTVRDIRVLELFREYWHRKIEEPYRRTRRLTRDALSPTARYLFRIVQALLDKGVASIPKAELPALTGDPGLDRYTCTYVRLLDEDVIIEEETSAIDGTTMVKFVYEEFMEFVIARYLMNELADHAEGEIVNYVAEFTASMPEFLSRMGVLVFLALMLREERGISVWPLLVRRKDPKSTEVLFDALRRLSEDGLDETTDEVMRELLSSHSATGNCVQAMRLCCQQPYRDRAALADCVLACCESDDQDRHMEAAKTAMFWADRRLMRKVVEFAESDDLRVCAVIAESIASGEHRMPRDRLDRLMRALAQHGEDAIRARLAIAMAAVADAESLQALKSLIDGSSRDVKSRIAQECRGFRDRPLLLESACDVLERLCRDDDEHVVVRAIAVYGAYPQERAIRLLMQLAGSTERSARVQHAATQQLVEYARLYCMAENLELDARDAAEAIARLCEACADAAGPTASVLRKLRVAATRSPYLMRLAAVTGGIAARALLLSMLREKRRKATVELALREIWRLSDEEVVDQVTHIAGSRRTALRQPAIRALGRMTHPKAAETLIALLGDDSPEVVGCCLELLCSKRHEVIQCSLVDMASRRDVDEVVREKLAHELRRLPPKAVMDPLLIMATSDPSPAVRRTAEESLTFVRDQAAASE